MSDDPFGLGLGWGVGGFSGGDYSAVPVGFDGTNDYLLRGAGLTGAADSKVFSGSIWFRRSGADVFERLLHSTADALSMFAQSAAGGNNMSVFAENAAGTQIFRINLAIPTTDANWHHLLWSRDGTTAHAYLDDVITAVTTNTDDTIDFTATEWAVAASTAGANKFSGDLADTWLRFGGALIDLSVEANRRLFITANGTPADPVLLPSAGIVELRGPVSTYHTNKGSGGGFTLNGALGAGSSPVKVGVGP